MNTLAEQAVATFAHSDVYTIKRQNVSTETIDAEVQALLANLNAVFNDSVFRVLSSKEEYDVENEVVDTCSTILHIVRETPQQQLIREHILEKFAKKIAKFRSHNVLHTYIDTYTLPASVERSMVHLRYAVKVLVDRCRALQTSDTLVVHSAQALGNALQQIDLKIVHYTKSVEPYPLTELEIEQWQTQHSLTVGLDAVTLAQGLYVEPSTERSAEQIEHGALLKPPSGKSIQYVVRRIKCALSPYCEPHQSVHQHCVPTEPYDFVRIKFVKAPKL